jgi:hypothetical protein
VKITLGMTTDKLTILSEGDITFNNTSTLYDRSSVRFERVLWVLKASTTMTN